MSTWETIRDHYHVWHVDRIPNPTPNEQTFQDEHSHTNIQPNMEMNEWQYLSRLVPTGNINLCSLDMLGLREIDTSHPWDQIKVSRDTLEIALSFISYHRRNTTILQEMNPLYSSRSTCSTNQHTAFNIIMHHVQAKEPREPLKMIIQGTRGTRKSYCIHCIKETLSSQAPSRHSPLLLLTPTRVATFNIHATTIHAGLRIPIKDMIPLQGQSLVVFQEEMKHIHYILIDDMSFIGSIIFVQVESCLSNGKTSLCRRNSRKELMDNLYYCSQIGNNILTTWHLCHPVLLPPVVSQPSQCYTNH
jgi:hypothetical protein